MPMTRRFRARSAATSGVKSLSPEQITKVDTNPRSYASSMASTASLMSAAFLRTAPVRCGMSISSQLCSTRVRRSPANSVQSA